MREPVLEVSNLRKVYGRRGGEVVVVDDVSFGLARGECLAIVGESGSGKSTTAKMIVGLANPTSGSISVDGHDRSFPARSSRMRRRRGGEVQLVFQDPYSSLDPHQTPLSCVSEVLGLHTALRGRAIRTRALELLEQVGLSAHLASRLPKSLSGGQRQRVVIARSLAAEPKVLILDEAVAALDTSIKAQVINLLLDLRESTDVAYLFISHDLAVVRQIGDRVAVMRSGQIVETGAAEKVLLTPEHAYTQALVAATPRPGWRPGAPTSSPAATSVSRSTPSPASASR
jgi:ABC-type glutathione transport system ATPase component